MLYLNPPIVQVNGLTLYPDHERTDTWYYMPNAPRVAVDAAGRPVWNLLRFRAEGEEGGGLLSFDVDLRVDESVLTDAARKLKSALHLDEDPVLGPLPVEDGTVRLVVLGVDSSGPMPAPGEPLRFVEKIVHAAKPALFGDERAAFSVRLDAEGSTAILDAMNGVVQPIGVIYSLDYYALRPAYQVKLDVDWDRMQSRLDNSFSAGFLFFSTDIREVVDKLIDERAIVIEVDTFVPEGVKEHEGVIAGRDRAVAAVYSMITDAFFKPSVDPAALTTGVDDALKFLDDLSRVGHASFSYNHLDYTRIDRKRLDVNIRERTTVKRTIFPQGHISGFVGELTEAGLTLTDLVREINLDDPWFDERKVEVIPTVDFASGHVASMDVTLEYGGDHRSLHFTSNDPQTVAWSSVVVDGRMVEPVAVEYTVNLVQVDRLDRPLALHGTTEPVLGDAVTLRATDLFHLIPVNVMDDGVPWDRWQRVTVDVAMDDHDNDVHQTITLELTAANTSWAWRPYVVGDAVPPVRYRLTFHGATGAPLVLPEAVAAGGEVKVRDPRPNRRTLSVVPSLPWATVDRAFVDLRYRDAANQVDEQQSLEFSEADPATKTFMVDLLDPAARVVQYDVTILFKDGTQRLIEECATVSPRLMVRPDMARRAVVTVRTDPQRFAAAEVARIDVAVTLPGGAADAVTLTRDEPRAVVEFDAPAGPLALDYKATYRHGNGLSTSHSDHVAAGDVVIPLD
ncbi:MAG: hypothetical protein Q7V88_15440 [Actinomycetota bacterium]|nr:hypothetical protein [Actinomycetota bacterium]